MTRTDWPDSLKVKIRQMVEEELAKELERRGYQPARAPRKVAAKRPSAS